jgi:hypothetical protein
MRRMMILAMIILRCLIVQLIRAFRFFTILVFRSIDHESNYDIDMHRFYRSIQTKTRFDFSGHYFCIRNILKYPLNQTEILDLLSWNLHTYVEQCHLLLPHVTVSNGLVSSSVYIQDEHITQVIVYIFIWFRSYRQLSKILNVHLILSTSSFQSTISRICTMNRYHLSYERISIVCLGVTFKQHISHVIHCQQLTDIVRTVDNNSAACPSNLFRTVEHTGITLVNAQHYLIVHMSIFPSLDLNHCLIAFISQIVSNQSFNCVLDVLPTYEIHRENILRTIRFSDNTYELIYLSNDEHIQTYEQTACSLCQQSNE